MGLALKSAFHIPLLHSPAGRQVITVVYWKITPSEAQVGEKTQYIYDTGLEINARKLAKCE